MLYNALWFLMFYKVQIRRLRGVFDQTKQKLLTKLFLDMLFFLTWESWCGLMKSLCWSRLSFNGLTNLKVLHSDSGESQWFQWDFHGFPTISSCLKVNSSVANHQMESHNLSLLIMFNCFGWVLSERFTEWPVYSAIYIAWLSGKVHKLRNLPSFQLTQPIFQADVMVISSHSSVQSWWMHDFQVPTGKVLVGHALYLGSMHSDPHPLRNQLQGRWHRENCWTMMKHDKPEQNS